MKKKNIIILFVLFFIFNKSFSNDITIFSNIDELERISSMSILEDKTGKLTFDEVVRSPQFIKNEKVIPNLGVSSSSFWIKFQVQNATNTDRLVLFLEAPTMDEVELYTLQKDGKITEQRGGETKGFFERKYNDPNYIFDVDLQPGETLMFFLKVKSIEQMMVPLSVGTRNKAHNIIADNNLVFGLYCGFILVMFFYNLFLYFTVRDNSYLFYITYLLLIGLTQISLKGYTVKYLWPNSAWLTSHSVVILSSSAAITGMLFIRSFLMTAKYTPKLNRGLDIINAIFLLSIILSILNFGQVSFTMMQLNTLFCSFFGLYIGYRISKKGYRPAKFFLLAWSILLGGAIVFVLKDFGIIPFNRLSSYTLQIASALETIMLSFALADRINILKKEKEESQRRELKALQEADRLLKEQNVILERQVEERTADLTLAIKNLKDTQSQLVNAEKMASLGQLTAGIAHEINNPINFVSSSIKPLKRDIGDLLNILSKYEEVNEGNINEKVFEINQLKSDLDIEYVKEEINSLLKGIDDGASRTAEIVKGLKTFSRIDETDLKRVDLNEGLDSTLILLNSIMFGKIQIVKNYEAIPKIECYAGRINQVFMNILNNAIHAVLQNYSVNNVGVITITTKDVGEQVMISIKDNGTGIPENIKSKIFDPFFTTKDVGEGTGLGLSIVYNIIESHNGKIELQSEPGQGTEFIIILPKLQVTKS